VDGHLRTGPDLSSAFARILVASALVKLALAISFADLAPRYDETEYAAYGRAIAERGAEPVLWRAPAYQWFVAAGLTLAGGRPVGVRVLQALVSIAACVLVYRVGRARFGERPAFAAAAFTAFYPSEISFSHLFWSETLYGALVLAAFERALSARESARWQAAALAGVFLGAATLTRSVGAAWAAATAAWLLAGGTRHARGAGALVLAWAIVVVPWSLVASERAGRFVLVDTNSGFNLWSGNNDRIPGDLPSLWCLGLPPENGIVVPGPLGGFLPGGAWREEVRAQMASEGVLDPEGPGGDDWYRREAVRSMKRDPAEALSRIPLKFAAFWAPDFFLPRHLARDWYGAAPPILVLVIVACTWIAAGVPLLAGPAALGAMRASPFRSLAVTWIVVSIGIHALAYGHSRMHAPLVPILVLAFAGALAERAPRTRWLLRGAPWAALALAAWVAFAPVVAGLYVQPGPRHEFLARVLGAVRHAPLPGTRWAAWMAASRAESKGDYAAAEEILRAGPWVEDPWTHFALGRIALSEAAAARAPAAQAWALALPELERAAELDPHSRVFEMVRDFARQEHARAIAESGAGP
jgi:4-amino-4-deoxy-L-arabinose transferase-like glycosyltransferase